MLAGEPYPHPPGGAAPPGKPSGTSNLKSPSVVKTSGSGSGNNAEDVSVAISKLTYNIEDVEKQLKNVVS